MLFNRVWYGERGLPTHGIVDASPERPQGAVARGEVELACEDLLELRRRDAGPGLRADASVADAERTRASGERNEV